MNGLPTGTVTFLMSDVESSTALWLEHRTGMDRAMAELDATVSEVVGRRNGTVISSRGEGDSHFAVFDRASSAVQAAIELQRVRAEKAWPRVRVAVHTGESDPIGGDYLGACVNATARIRTTVHGGQVVCSPVAAELARDTVGEEGIELRSLGAHRLRDLPSPIELFQACAPDLQTEFPPLATVDSQATALMAIAVVDQVGSRERVRRDGHPAVWQRLLFRRLRTAAYAHDGRFFKLTGDGCMTAFEDPRAALAFANELCSDPRLSVCAAVTVGLVEIVEGELSGTAVFEAFARTRDLQAGAIWASPVTAALMGSERA